MVVDSEPPPQGVAALLNRFEALSSNSSPKPSPGMTRLAPPAAPLRKTDAAPEVAATPKKQPPPVPELRPFRVDSRPSSRSTSPFPETPVETPSLTPRSLAVTPTSLNGTHSPTGSADGKPPIPAKPRSISRKSSSSSFQSLIEGIPPPLPVRHATLPVPTISGAVGSPSGSPPGTFLPPPTRTASPQPIAPSSPASPVKKPITSHSNSDILPPPQRTLATQSRPPSRSEPPKPIVARKESQDSVSESDEPDDTTKPTVELFPDASLANRRPPHWRPKVEIKTTMNFVCAAVHGHLVAIGCAHHVKIFDLTSQTFVKGVPTSHETTRVTAVAFKHTSSPEESAKKIWAGTKEGQLFELDLERAEVVAQRPTAHAAPLVYIGARHSNMLTLDATGKCNVWTHTGGADLKAGPSKTFRLPEAGGIAFSVGYQLWVCSLGTSKGPPSVRVYQPLTGDGFVDKALIGKMPDHQTLIQPGAVTAGTYIPWLNESVYMSHDTGHISQWDRATAQFKSVQRISLANITCIRGVCKFLWAGFRSGLMQVYDTQTTPWRVLKSWKAHTDAVLSIMIDIPALWTMSRLTVVTTGADGAIRSWNGFLGSDYIDRQLMVRQADYCDYRAIRMLFCTWNLSALNPNILSSDPLNTGVLNEVLTSTDAPDVIVFGFQEMIDLDNKTVTAKSFFLGRKKKTDGKLQDQVSHQYQRWRDKLAQAVAAVNSAYTILQADVLVGLFTCVFVKNSIKTSLRDPAMALIKTGFSGRFGNKGAIMARFVVDDSSICLVNCHLAAGMNHVRQRNHDLADILDAKEIFPHAADLTTNAYAGGAGGEMIYDHDIVFVAGDLNFRIDGRRDQVIRSAESGDFHPLIEQDQLKKQFKSTPGFRLQGYREAPLTFAPTYKYDKNSSQYDSSDKGRIPAWCDRILWRTEASHTVQNLHYKRYECTASDHRPVSAAFDVKVKRIDPERRAQVLQEVEREWTAKEQALLAASQRHYKDFL